MPGRAGLCRCGFNHPLHHTFCYTEATLWDKRGGCCLATSLIGRRGRKDNCCIVWLYACQYLWRPSGTPFVLSEGGQGWSAGAPDVGRPAPTHLRRPLRERVGATGSDSRSGQLALRLCGDWVIDPPRKKTPHHGHKGAERTALSAFVVRRSPYLTRFSPGCSMIGC